MCVDIYRVHVRLFCRPGGRFGASCLFLSGFSCLSSPVARLHANLISSATPDDSGCGSFLQIYWPIGSDQNTDCGATVCSVSIRGRKSAGKKKQKTESKSEIAGAIPQFPGLAFFARKQSVFFHNMHLVNSEKRSIFSFFKWILLIN